MAEIVRMPKLSDTMTEGVVAEWHKNIGDQIESGDLLAEIETDKATMEFESFQDGVLLHIGVEKGQTAPVDSILAILGEKGEDVSKLLKEAEKEESQPQDEVKSEEKTVSEPKPVAEKVVSSPPPVQNTAASTSLSYPKASELNLSDVKVSPLAKKLAEERGLNLKFIKGSGTEGRIIKRDIDNYQISGSNFSGVESFTDFPVTQMRKVIAQRLAESKFTAPHFYLSMSIDMDNAIAARLSIDIER
jgi:pyruvate dehydrogenase E2 component (dihydrolipoamide acetyltransferase)